MSNWKSWNVNNHINQREEIIKWKPFGGRLCTLIQKQDFTNIQIFIEVQNPIMKVRIIQLYMEAGILIQQAPAQYLLGRLS